MHLRRAGSMGCLTLLALICVPPSVLAAEGHPTVDLQLKEGWKRLFNGKDLAGWEIKTTNGAPGRKGAWVVQHGAIARKAGGAYLWSEKPYGDFILDLQFKVSPGCNSGVIIRHRPDPAVKQYWWNGLLEMQVLDSHGKARPGMHDCGALYDMVAPSANPMKAAGQWNRVTITAKGSGIVIVMNGLKIIDADLDDWTEANKNPDGTPNKYHKPMKDLSRSGYILLQDHGKPVWFRNIHVKPLE